MRHAPGRAEFFRVDLSSQLAVRAVARTIIQAHPIVDVLVNNAGARHDTFADGPDGIERTFATNHLGHFLLTALLLDALAASPSGRVITVTSSAAAQARPDGKWALGASDFDRKQAYAKSKHANRLFALELAARLAGSPPQSIAFDPGIVATRFGRNNGLRAWLKHLVYHGLRRELVSAGKPAAALAGLACAAALPAPPDAVWRGPQPWHPTPFSYDRQEAAQLWRLSVDMTGLGNHTGATWRRINSDTGDHARNA